MTLREALARVLNEYRPATAQPFASHPVANLLRKELRDTVRSSLGETARGLVVEGSAGAGNWAAVPWLSVFDPAVTHSATRGYYVVYLFHSTQPLVHLSLNQG